jgi:predicted nuclease of predicted toxin-antitoxin system
MKILLDECVTKHLKPLLTNHDVFTVRDMHWSGTKNGELLALCVENSLDILLTIDKNMEHQQSLRRFPLTIVVLNSINSTVDELALFLTAFHAILPTFQKYQVYVIDK